MFSTLILSELPIASVLEISGLELERNDNNNFEVVNLTFMGPAEQIGMDFYDEITRIEISSVDRPAKEYVYLFAFVLLILITYSQRRLSLRQNNQNNS